MCDCGPSVHQWGVWGKVMREIFCVNFVDWDTILCTSSNTKSLPVLWEAIKFEEFQWWGKIGEAAFRTNERGIWPLFWLLRQCPCDPIKGWTLSGEYLRSVSAPQSEQRSKFETFYRLKNRLDIWENEDWVVQEYSSGIVPPVWRGH